jgi:hypothetical protein
MYLRKICRVMSSLAGLGLLIVAWPVLAGDVGNESALAPGPAGKYAGVAPGSASKNPLPPAPADTPRLIWTGFQPTATGSRVFLQTTQAVTYEVREGQPSKSGRSVMTVVLRGCRIHMANNRRSLDTRAFPTPVQGFAAKQHKNDVELRVSLRERATAAMGTEAGPDGTQFLVLDFPPGKAEDIASPAQSEASTSDVLTASETPQGVMRASQDESAEHSSAPKKSRARGKDSSSEGTPGNTGASSP